MQATRGNEKILIVDDEEKVRTILTAVLRDEGYDVETAQDGIEAIAKAATFAPQLAIVDLRMPRMDGLETIIRIKERLPKTVAIILTAHGTIQSAVQAIKQGVYDYLTKPFDNDQMLLVVKRALEVYYLTEEVDALKREIRRRYGLETIIGESHAMQQVRSQIRQVAGTDATVLIEGESGTGKELVAKAIHYESRRGENPLVIVDCTTIPASLIESEFFGHEKGAFTDARERRVGKFEEADTGTIFLDEVGELPPEAQAKLLRVLQEKELTRVGGNLPINVDVRVIAATNRNIERTMQEGRFREDLYYRLNVLKLRLPPLREHVEDIPLYVHHFLVKHQETFGKRVYSISDDALEVLKRCEWKGNIRELENVVQRAMLSVKGERIEVSDLAFLDRAGPSTPLPYNETEGLEGYLRAFTERVERSLIRETLKAVGGNQTKAAERLKISRRTLFTKMQQYGLGQ
jgi:two-component system response regulator AtoC